MENVWKCSYTRIFLVYAETSRSDSNGLQKIPKVYDYDYDITFFLLTNVNKKNHHTASAKEHLDAQLVKEFPEIQVALQESNGLVLDWSQPGKKKNDVRCFGMPHENHSRTKNPMIRTPNDAENREPAHLKI